MLHDRQQLPELRFMKQFHDSSRPNFNYENQLLKKSLSPYMYGNNIMNGFLERLEPMVSLLFDHMNLAKNFKNYMVDKYHYKQRG
jgi:hypothetical protein